MLTLTLCSVREQPNIAASELFDIRAFGRSFLLDPKVYRDFYWGHGPSAPDVLTPAIG